MNMDFKSELERTYCVLEPEEAGMQNDLDIREWYNKNLISKQEYENLLCYNNQLYGLEV